MQAGERIRLTKTDFFPGRDATVLNPQVVSEIARTLRVPVTADRVGQDTVTWAMELPNGRLHLASYADGSDFARRIGALKPDYVAFTASDLAAGSANSLRGLRGVSWDADKVTFVSDERGSEHPRSLIITRESVINSRI